MNKNETRITSLNLSVESVTQTKKPSERKYQSKHKMSKLVSDFGFSSIYG